MKRIKTFLFIVSITFIATITTSFQHTHETLEQAEGHIYGTNTQTKGISSCIYAGGFCGVNGKIYHGITATKP